MKTLNTVAYVVCIIAVVVVTLFAVTTQAEASTIYPAYQCNHIACPVWGAFSFSQKMAFVMWVIGCSYLTLHILRGMKATKARKSVFQSELDAAIRAHHNRQFKE